MHSIGKGSSSRLQLGVLQRAREGDTHMYGLEKAPASEAVVQ